MAKLRVRFFSLVAVMLGLLFVLQFVTKIRSGNPLIYMVMIATAGGAWAAAATARATRRKDSGQR